jgi:hypothetical protein
VDFWLLYCVKKSVSKRKYNKKSSYWEKFSKPTPKEDGNPITPIFAGDSYYTEASVKKFVSSANHEEIQGSGGRRSNRVHKTVKKNQFSNIESGMLPYQVGENGVDIRSSVELCQKAYANIPIFRNAIDIMSEFANSQIKLEGGNTKGRDFVSKWMDRISLWKVKDQYFREYYRSGNVFMYRVDGKFSNEDFNQMSKVYGSSIKPGNIPLKYIFLNPYDIIAKRATSFSEGQYFKVLSEYDLERLLDPKTEYDKQVYDSLGPELKEKIKTKNFQKEGAEIPLDAEKLVYSFYKKQDYEPFATPFGYPVLDDINYKIELKKIDQAICRTIENVILLITMGTEPDKGGINPRNLQAMQGLFTNESVGRVLVSDYTTKADFVIPDLRRVVGPDKYEIVNQDIKEGLQNIIVGDERYSNTQVKAQIFLERLKEARNAFLNDFLQPQIKMVCQNLGFRDYPKARFEEVDIKDEVQLQRVVTRLLELGILTPEQGIDAIKTGIYPRPDELSPAQDDYSEERRQGKFNPLVGGVPMMEPEGGDPAIGPSGKEQGRPTGTKGIPQENASLISRKDIQEVIYKAESLSSFVKKSLRSKLKKRKLTKLQDETADDLCESIICSTDIEDWESVAEACVTDNEKIADLKDKKEIIEIGIEKELQLYPSALYYHSKRRQEDD